jgi:hypothetical protein
MIHHLISFYVSVPIGSLAIVSCGCLFPFCYGNVVNKSLHSKEHLQIDLIDNSVFILLCWSVINVRNVWEVPMEGSHIFFWIEFCS